MKIKISLILLTGFILLTLSVTAQRRHYFFYGKVLDQVTKSPISNVNLTFEGKPSGTSTDRKGEFSFYIDTLPVNLIISHIGYETKKILLDKTSFTLHIILQPASTVLPEVVITGKTEYEPFFREPRYSVFDYEVSNDTVYILVYHNYLSQAELICKNLKGDTVARSGKIGFIPKKLVRDCLGFIHILSSDSAYQVFVDGPAALLIYPVTCEKFTSILGECVLSTPNLLYFKQASDDGLGLDYYWIDRKTFRKQMISAVRDSVKLKMIRRNDDDRALLKTKRIPDGRENFVNWSYVHKIQYRPLTSEICRIEDFICIFNNSSGTIEFYLPDGVFSSKLQVCLDDVKDMKWTREIYPDRTQKKVYTTFMKNGICYLYRINMNTGELYRTLQVSHVFPQKIRVYSGYLYYLYDIPEMSDNRALFRQKV